MRWRLSKGYKMAALTVAVGALLTALNVQAVRVQGGDVLSLASLGASVFVVALGFALLVQREPSE